MTPEEIQAKLAELDRLERQADKISRWAAVLVIAGALLQLIGVCIALYQYLTQ